MRRKRKPVGQQIYVGLLLVM